jgi:D-cysteine desulfhydrase
VKGFVDAAKELAGQVTAGQLAEPDLVVVALGSGGTAAGLAAGLALEGMRTRVLAVTVAEPTWLVERSLRSLARRCASKIGANVFKRLEIDRRYLGVGYGHPMPLEQRAMKAAAEAGITLDSTYTAKAFAAALDRAALGRERTILYWHTLSSAQMAQHLSGAPEEAAIDVRLRRLIREPVP